MCDRLIGLLLTTTTTYNNNVANLCRQDSIFPLQFPNIINHNFCAKAHHPLIIIITIIIIVDVKPSPYIFLFPLACPSPPHPPPHIID
jgi:hypothetical protein